MRASETYGRSGDGNTIRSYSCRGLVASRSEFARAFWCFSREFATGAAGDHGGSGEVLESEAEKQVTKRFLNSTIDL